MQKILLGIVGDYDPTMYTHVALNNSIDHCHPHLEFEITATWIPTERIDQTFFSEKRFHAFWIAPGSPYKNDAGVYEIIRWSRENDFPIFGTCGGFQYMIIEYARNVLGLVDAEHAETNTNADQLIISKMSCSLKGQQETVFIQDKNSWLFQVLKENMIEGKFNCSYGLNPTYQKFLQAPPFYLTAFSKEGEARAFELRGHKFFKGTLFQPPLDSSKAHPNKIVLDFLKHI